MTETYVTATDFRVHLKDLANQVASGGEPVVMARHGYDMVVMISWADFELLRKHRTKTSPVKRLEHPDHMPVEEVEREYQATEGATDPETLRWRGRALVSVRARTGRYPGGLPS
jgi:prevent-host-death family protein